MTTQLTLSPAKQWEERLARQSTSGLTVKAFCEQESVSVPTYYYWRRKLQGRPAAKSLSPSGRLKQVQVIAVETMTAWLPGSIRLDVPTGDEEAVRAIVRELVFSGHEIAGDKQ